MDIFIARLNLEHFNKMLSTERDPVRRIQLLRLIRDENEKMALATAAAEIRAKFAKL